MEDIVRTVTLTSATGEKVDVLLTIPAATARLLSDFTEFADELASLGVVQRGLKASIQIKGNSQEGTNVSTPELSGDERSALLHKLRPFLLKKEPTSFHKVSNQLTGLCAHEYLRDFISAQKSRYESRTLQSIMSVKVSDTEILSDELLWRWLNSFEYHRDSDKRTDLKELLGEGIQFSTGIFIWMLFDRAIAILGLSSLIKFILGKPEKVPSQV